MRTEVRAAGLALLLLLAVPGPVAAEEGEDRYEALLASAEKKLAEKDYDGAATLFASAARLRTDTARPLVGLARAVFSKAAATGDPQGIAQAKVLLKEARSRDGEYGGTWFLWGEISLAVRDHANAVNGFRGAIVKDHRAKEAKPLLARSLLWLGVDQARAGNVDRWKVVETFDEAGRMFEALAKDEAYPAGEREEFARLRRSAMRNTAAVHHRAGDLPRAEKIVRELIEMAPGDPEYRFDLGLLLSDGGRRDAARVQFKKSLELSTDPEWVEPLLPLARLASAAGSDEEAEAGFARYLETRPDSAEAWLALADHHLRRERPEKAVEAAVRAFEIVPRHAPAARTLAEAHRRAGRGEEAAKWEAVARSIERERR